MLSGIMDLICSEPSPSSPTEKFFESEKLSIGVHSQSKSLGITDCSISNGSSVSGHLSVSHKSGLESHPVTSQIYDQLSSSPLSAHSDASSGYDSMVNISPSSDGEFHLGEVNFHSFNLDTQLDFFSTRARLDPHLLDDLRIPRQMLQIENRYVPRDVDQLVYMNDKYETDEKARRIVTEWMLEVCEELKCEEVTFPLAVNYLDRFILATPDIRKYQLQLVAVVCLLIASKLRQCNPIDPNDLREMTDRSVSVSQILNWETLVLNRLNWDVSSVLATDYLDHILVNLPELCYSEDDHELCYSSYPCWYYQSTASDSSHLHSSNVLSQSCTAISRPTKRHLESSTSYLSPVSKRIRVDQSSTSTSLHHTIRRHASTLVSLCSTELQFACVPPSLIAAACVASAVRGIFHQSKHSHSISHTLASYSTQLQIEIDSQCIEQFMNRIEVLFALRSSKLGANQSSSSSESTPNSAVIDSKATNSVLSSSKVEVESLAYYQPHTSTHLSHPQLITQSHSIVHSPIHSNSHCPSTSTSSSNSSPSTSVSSSSCFVANHYFVHTTFAQVASAKQLLVCQPQNRVQFRHCLAHSHNIPSASAIFSRSSHTSVSHLHDASNTPAVSSFYSHSTCSQSTFKPKLCTVNPSGMSSTLMTFPPDLSDTYQEDEDRENIPVFIVNGSRVDSSASSSTEIERNTSVDSMSAYSSLISTEELPEDEDEGLQEDLYF